MAYLLGWASGAILPLLILYILLSLFGRRRGRRRVWRKSKWWK